MQIQMSHAIRDCDAIAILADSGRLEWGAVNEIAWQMANGSTISVTIDGQPAAIGGLLAFPKDPGVFLAWMAAASIARRSPRSIVRAARDLCAAAPGVSRVLAPVDLERSAGARLAALARFKATDDPGLWEWRPAYG